MRQLVNKRLWWHQDARYNCENMHTCVCKNVYPVHGNILHPWRFVVQLAWPPVAVPSADIRRSVSSPVVFNTTFLPRTKTFRCAVSRMPVVSSVAVERCWVRCRCTRWPVLQRIVIVNVQVLARRRWKTIQNFLCVPSCAAANIIFVVALYLHPAMCANICRIISFRPFTSSLADLSARSTFYLLRRSASRHAVYISSHLLHLYCTTWSVDKEIVFLPSAVYRSYSRAAVLPHVGVTIHSGTGPFRSKYPLLRQYLLSPDRSAIKKLTERRHSESVCWSLIGAWWFVSFKLFISHFNLRGTVFSCMYFTSVTPHGVHSVTDRSDPSTYLEYCGALQAFHPSRPSPRSFVSDFPSFCSWNVSWFQVSRCSDYLR